MLHGWTVSLRRLSSALGSPSISGHKIISLQPWSQAKACKLAKFYAVKVGRQPGIFRSWDDCQKQVDGYSGAVYKSFKSLTEAEHFNVTGYQVVAATSERKADGVSEPVKKPRKQKAKASPPADECVIAQQTETATSSRLTYRLEFDGASRGNPGAAGAGAVLFRDDTGDEVGQVCMGLGRATNNVAEYTALIKGMEAAQSLGVQHLNVAGDSMLVVNQVNARWKVSNEGLKPLHRRANELKAKFEKFSIRHVFREFNKAADALSNTAIDTGGWEGLRLVGLTECKRQKAAASKD